MTEFPLTKKTLGNRRNKDMKEIMTIIVFAIYRNVQTTWFVVTSVMYGITGLI